MKFTTEYDLRALYKTAPFTSYEIEEGTRLTPGARQFLADKKISMNENEHSPVKNSANDTSNPVCCKPDWRDKKIAAEISSVEAVFLLTAQELISSDGWLARDVLDLGELFSNISNIIAAKDHPVESLTVNECTGMKKESFAQDLGDCFKITAAHIKHEKANKILHLHRLRCAVRSFSISLLYLYPETNCDECNEALSRTYQIINSLSQMICAALGGKQCLRKP